MPKVPASAVSERSEMHMHITGLRGIARATHSAELNKLVDQLEDLLQFAERKDHQRQVQGV